MKLSLKSINVQILFIVLCAFVLVQVFSSLMSGRNLKQIIDNSQEHLYTEKIDLIIKELNRQNDRLINDPEGIFSLDDIKEQTLDWIKDTYYSEENLKVFPFIATKDNIVILHPRKESGQSFSPEKAKGCNLCDKQDFTVKNCSGKGDVWCISGYFEPWGWYVIYAVPLDEKYKDFVSYRKEMAISVTLLLLLVLLSLSFILMHFTRPIIRLTEITGQIAKGQWDQPLNINQNNEIGVLANSFDHMRNSIKEKIDSLNQEISERKRVEEESARLEIFLTNMIDEMPSTLICVNHDLIVTRLNSTAILQMGSKTRDAYGQKMLDLFPSLSPIVKHIEHSIENSSVYREKNIADLVDGEKKYFNLTIYPLTAEDVPGAVIRIDDVSREYQLEQQLHQREKMESVGLLAGGIAHDFNNMLAGIMGAAEIIQLHLSGNDKALKFNQSILETCEQASGLVENLLTFSREQAMEITPVDIHHIIEDALLFLSHTIDRRILLQSNLDAKSSKIMGDTAQLESVFINLGINASQAFESSGMISVKTSNIEINSKECSKSSFNLEPGNYIEIEFIDNGLGIEQKDLSKIFEPFFTTKEQGLGSGLGLASVYGTICQHKGAVDVSSEKGDGTTFRIVFLLDQKPVSKKISVVDEVIHGTGTVLVIDDEDFVRGMTQEMLETLGYSVLTAENGEDGILIYKENSAKIDVVLLDLMMPDMRGDKCFNLIREHNPKARVIIASGYLPEEDMVRLKKNGLAGLLSKPYPRANLSQMLHNILHSG